MTRVGLFLLMSISLIFPLYGLNAYKILNCLSINYALMACDANKRLTGNDRKNVDPNCKCI